MELLAEEDKTEKVGRIEFGRIWVGRIEEEKTRNL